MIEINYKGKLPSVNHMYGRTKFGRVFLKKEGKFLKAVVAASTSEKLPQDVEIGYRLNIHANWYNKGFPKTTKVRIKQRDSNNLVKLIVDAACEAIGIDDSQIFDESVRKVQSDEEGFTIKLFILPEYQ